MKDVIRKYETHEWASLCVLHTFLLALALFLSHAVLKTAVSTQPITSLFYLRNVKIRCILEERDYVAIQHCYLTETKPVRKCYMWFSMGF